MAANKRAAYGVPLAATVVSFPSNGRPGDILLGQGGAIAGKAAIVNASGTPIPIDTTPFVPDNDNLTDLGDSTHRFRTLYLGTAISNPSGNLEVRFNEATARELVVANANVGGIANVSVQGSVSVGAGNANGGARIYDDGDTLQLVAAGSEGTPATRGLRVMRAVSAVNELRVYPSIAANPVQVVAEGDDANIDLRLLPKGNGQVKLYGIVDVGGTPTAQITFFGGTLRSQHTNIADPAGGGTVDAEARAAIVSILGLLRGSTGYGLTLG